MSAAGANAALRPPTTRDIAAARELHRESGVGARAIARRLVSDGVNAHPGTVRLWIDDEAAERHRQVDARLMAARRAEASGGVLRGGRRRTVEFRMARMRGLSEAGLSCAAIATVLAFDEMGPALSEDAVRYALKTGSVPRRWRVESGR